jgi:hypothetical protein
MLNLIILILPLALCCVAIIFLSGEVSELRRELDRERKLRIAVSLDIAEELDRLRAMVSGDWETRLEDIPGHEYDHKI